MGALEELRARLGGLLASIRSVPSPDFSSRYGARVQGIVIHTTESADGTLAAVANYFQSSGVQVSAHYVVEATPRRGYVWCDVVQCVDESQAAWTARSANRTTVNYELIGRASRTREEWLNRYRVQLETVAALVAEDTVQYGVPVSRGYPGVLGHGDLSKYGFPNDHTDPGPGFPWEEFLRMVRDATSVRTPPEESRQVSVKRPGRPAGAPRRIPRWAWRLDKWLSTKPAQRGPRPGTPDPLPAWYWPWRRWLHGVPENHPVV